MNKKLLIIIVAVLVLLGGGYYFYSQKSSGMGGIPGAGGGAFSSIQDALSRSMSLVCEYTDEEGIETKTYIKNGAVRISSAGGGEREAGEIIIKDNKMYMWSDVTKEGFVYTFEDTEAEDITGDMDLENADNRASMINAIEAYKDRCKVSTVADSYFVPPTDVNFQDMSSFFENLSNYQQPELPEGIEE